MEVVAVTVTIKSMHAGQGVDYLLRTVAVGDGDRSLRDPLTRYYAEEGTPPGYWLGSGVATGSRSMPRPRSGGALAEAFRSAVADTEVSRLLSERKVSDPVSREALVEFARKGCLCQLRAAEAHDLPLLRDLFIHSGTPAEVASRSETLRMLLDLSTCRQAEELSQDDFRRLVYFRQLDGSDYLPRRELVDVARRWRVYQGREYFAYVFNRMLRWVSRRGLAATDGGVSKTSWPPPRPWPTPHETA